MRPHLPKFDLFGVAVTSCSYEDVIPYLLECAQLNESLRVTALASHGLVEACHDSSLNEKLNCFEVVTPDGQPLRWGLNFFHNANLTERVYGPELMLRLCAMAARENLAIFLYGNTLEVVTKLKMILQQKFASLRVAGAVPSTFRPLTDMEINTLALDIKQSKASFVFVGLGCPQQEHVIHRLHLCQAGILVGVGAAFDFISGNKKMAPRWMQDNGLEWCFRLFSEPRRLTKRYMISNSIFLVNFFLKACGLPTWRRR